MSVHAFDEMNGTFDGEAVAPIRAAYVKLRRWLDETPADLIDARRSQAELLFRRIGITFTVYGDNESSERLIPFCIIPRVLTKPEWTTIERGLEQRVSAINAFLSDIYGAQECIKAGVIPADLVDRNPHYRPEMRGVPAPHNVYVHIAGIDVVRVNEDDILRSRGQRPHALRGLLHAGEPRGDDAALPRAVHPPSRCAGRGLPGVAARHVALGRAGAGRARTRRWCC